MMQLPPLRMHGANGGFAGGRVPHVAGQGQVPLLRQFDRQSCHGSGGCVRRTSEDCHAAALSGNSARYCVSDAAGSPGHQHYAAGQHGERS